MVIKVSRKMPIFLQEQKIRMDIVHAGKDPLLFDLSAHMDSTLSFPENRYNIATLLNYKIGNKQKRVQATSHRGGQTPLNYDTLMYQMDDYNKEERRRVAAERRRIKGSPPRPKISKKKFKKIIQLPLWQCDAWPRHPTMDMDKARKALPPGRRRSAKTGKIYYERRRNRSDMPGTNI